uniref:Protein FAR1-RELATED SEQUENCE n=1 Tax=Heterorhabditis bacteriophora TaxID=37862 RepID=A0A1I7XMZ1_HETBA
MEELEELRRREKFEKMQGGEGHARSAVERFGEEGFRFFNDIHLIQGGELAFGANRQKATSSINKEVEETVIKSTKTMKTHGQHVAKGAKTKKFNENICIATKCDFEDGKLNCIQFTLNIFCHHYMKYKFNSILL